MNMFKRAVRRWLMSGIESDIVVGVRESEPNENITFSVIQAENGTILKVARHKPNLRGPDWTHTLHIVKEGETVVDVFRSVYATHLLESK